MSADTLLEVPQGAFELLRHRHDPRQPLRAWDAADEYLLLHLHELEPAGSESWVLMNDTFGALGVALARHHPVSVSDSVISKIATVANLARNAVSPDAVSFASAADPFDSLDVPHVVVMQVPASLAVLEDQLHRLRPLLHPETQLIAAAMTKHVHSSTIERFEHIIGPTPTTRARKKARLLLPTFDPELTPGPSPYPTRYQLPSGHTVVNHAGVFSADRLDHGTHLLLDHLEVLDSDEVAIDLGCGSGVIGLHLALASPAMAVTCVDASYAAVSSAAATFGEAFGDDYRAQFVAADGLDEVAPGSVDLVVTNPPFHADRARGDAVAWQFFHDARKVLRPGGRLIVVGNRHLGYHAKLRRLFGNAEVVASNPKFVVVAARKDR